MVHRSLHLYVFAMFVARTYLEQLIQSTEAAGCDDERLAVVQHPELTSEEVVKLER